MYTMTAAAVPRSVYLDAPALMRYDNNSARELTGLEIDYVSGGECPVCEDVRQFSNGAVAVGTGLSLGGFWNPAFLLAGGALAFTGAAGLVVADQLEEWMADIEKPANLKG